MRFRIPGTSIMVTACHWPRTKYRAWGRKGGHYTAGTPEANEARDRAEVAAYCSAHPDATVRDVAMCCNMGDGQAARLRALLTEK